MHGNQPLVFLLSLALLLGVARLLGELARSLGLPLVAGELSTGLLLGKTGLARLFPAAHAWLFQKGTPAADMLSGYTTVSVVMLLVVAGLEVDLGIVKRRGRSALLVASLGVLLPLVGGFVLGNIVPDSVILSPDRRTLFAMFLGVALSISALPVIAKTLLDLGLFKTDVGLLVMTVAMIDDMTGWLAFSLLLGPMRGGTLDIATLARTVSLAVGFALLCLIPGRRIIDRLLRAIEHDTPASAGRVLSFVAVLALFGASVTQAIGIHAVLGGFIVGVTIGDSPNLRERTRHTIHQFVTNIFAPVFFAAVTLHVDFISAFDPGLCASVFLVATITKLVGCAGGARLTGLPWREALAVGFGLNARGAMEIILALLALEAKLIDVRVFVALVTMALGTSLLAGATMKRLLYPRSASSRAAAEDAASLVREGVFVPRLAAATSARAIEELARSLEPALGEIVDQARISVIERELVAATGLGDRVAIPHAQVAGLTKPVVALGLSPIGIDFGAPDEQPANIVFLLLLPPKAYETEVRVLASLARSVFDETARTALLATSTQEAAVRCLDENARRIGERPLDPGMPGLADI